MPEADIPIDDEQIRTLWSDPNATITGIQIRDPQTPVPDCVYCKPESAVPEAVAVTSQKWGTWKACRGCGQSLLAALNGTPAGETDHPRTVRLIAREQLWRLGVRTNQVVVDPD